MMGANAKMLWRNLIQHFFDSQHCFAGSETGSITDAKNMRIDGKGFSPERGVHHHVGGLAPDPR